MVNSSRPVKSWIRGPVPLAGLAQPKNSRQDGRWARRKGPWRGIEAVEYATLEWVDWYNTRRLLEPIGYVPPREHETNYYREHEPQPEAAGLN